MSALITFMIFKKWQASKIKKIIVAVVLLVLIAWVSIVVTNAMAEELRVRATEILGAILYFN